MKNLCFCVALAASLFLAGCIKDNRANLPSDRIIRVSSTIYGHTATRASGNSWDAGDEIGIYMLPTGTTDYDNAFKANARYALESGTTSGSFEPAGTGDALQYPAEGGTFDFVAYYPFHTDIHSADDHVYKIDITTQNPSKAIDLLYTESKVTQNETETSLDLTFRHQLSKIVFNITDGDGASLTDATASIEGMNTTAEFDLETGLLTARDSKAAFAPIVTATASALTIEAIVLPGTDIDYNVVVALNNAGEETGTITMADRTYEKGKKYIYTARLVTDADEIAIEIVDAEIVDWETGNGSGENIGDISKGQNGGSDPAFTELLNETFTGLIGSNDKTSGSGGPFEGNENFIDYYYAYQAGDAIRVGTSYPGFIKSKNLELSGGNVKVSLKAKGWTTVEGVIDVTVGDQTKTVTYSEIISDGFGSYSVDFDNVTASSVKITATKQAFLDDVVVEVAR